MYSEDWQVTCCRGVGGAACEWMNDRLLKLSGNWPLIREREREGHFLSWEHPDWAATAALVKSLGGLLLGFCLGFLVDASCVKAHSLGSARSFFSAKKSVLIQSLMPFLTDLSSLPDLSRGLLSPHRKRHRSVNHHVLWQARPGTTELRSGHGLCRSYDPLLSESRHDREGHFQ